MFWFLFIIYIFGAICMALRFRIDPVYDKRVDHCILFGLSWPIVFLLALLETIMGIKIIGK